jgi:hypothetical protein
MSSILHVNNALAEKLPMDDIQRTVAHTLEATPCIDVHTHLYPAAFGKIGLWGIDELLTYHYLEAEFFRYSRTIPEQYFVLSKREQADAIWRTLFIENTPISEATRGVIAVLKAFGLPSDSSDLNEARQFFAGQSLEKHINTVFQLLAVPIFAPLRICAVIFLRTVFWSAYSAARTSTSCASMRANSIT